MQLIQVLLDLASAFVLSVRVGLNRLRIPAWSGSGPMRSRASSSGVGRGARALLLSDAALAGAPLIA